MVNVTGQKVKHFRFVIFVVADVPQGLKRFREAHGSELLLSLAEDSLERLDKERVVQHSNGFNGRVSQSIAVRFRLEVMNQQPLCIFVMVSAKIGDCFEEDGGVLFTLPLLTSDGRICQF